MHRSEGQGFCTGVWHLSGPDGAFSLLTLRNQVLAASQHVELCAGILKCTVALQIQISTNRPAIPPLQKKKLRPRKCECLQSPLLEWLLGLFSFPGLLPSFCSLASAPCRASRQIGLRGAPTASRRQMSAAGCRSLAAAPFLRPCPSLGRESL